MHLHKVSRAKAIQIGMAVLASMAEPMYIGGRDNRHEWQQRFRTDYDPAPKTLHLKRRRRRKRRRH